MDEGEAWDFVEKRWSHIAQYLYVTPSGEITDRYFFDWHFENENIEYPCPELAPELDEWADFIVWEFERRIDALGNGDRGRRYRIEQSADDRIYYFRREAALAQGRDPGEEVDQDIRRPDLAAEWQAIIEEIIEKYEAKKKGS